MLAIWGRHRHQFFPAKPLGCYGDGGAVFTEDDELAEAMISARIHGMGRVRYTHDRIGMTARLDCCKPRC